MPSQSVVDKLEKEKNILELFTKYQGEIGTGRMVSNTEYFLKHFKEFSHWQYLPKPPRRKP
jgi:hypothetical protein